jgi:hypothetical protein
MMAEKITVSVPAPLEAATVASPVSDLSVVTPRAPNRVGFWADALNDTPWD